MRSVISVFASLLAAAAVSCSSTEKVKKRPLPEGMDDQTTILDSGARVGGHYKTGGLSTGFYYTMPNFVKLLPDKYLGRGHVVQLLSLETENGLVRVKNSEKEIGYVAFGSLRIVPQEDEPELPEESAEHVLEKRIRQAEE